MTHEEQRLKEVIAEAVTQALEERSREQVRLSQEQAKERNAFIGFVIAVPLLVVFLNWSRVTYHWPWLESTLNWIWHALNWLWGYYTLVIGAVVQWLIQYWPK